MGRVGLAWMALVLMIAGQAARCQGMPSHQTGGVRTRFSRRLLNGDWGSNGGGDSSVRVSEPGAPPSDGDWSHNGSGGQQGNSETSQGQQNGQQWENNSGGGQSSGYNGNSGQQQQQQQQQQHQQKPPPPQQQQQAPQTSGKKGGTSAPPGYEFLTRAFDQASVRVVPRGGKVPPCGSKSLPQYFGQIYPGVLSSCLESKPSQGNKGR